MKIDAKRKRDEYVEKVRKLEKVKEHLSSKKNTGEADASSLSDLSNLAMERLHDDDYDPTSEMRSYFIGSPSSSKHLRFESEASTEEGKNSKSEPVTLDAIANLLHKQLHPIQSSISQMEGKFAQLQINVEGQFQEVRNVTERINHDLNERCSILEVNVENVHNESSKMASRIIDCESAILDIKEYITEAADKSLSSNGV